MPGLGDIFGKGSTFEQLMVWGVLSSVIGAGMAPFLQSLQSEVWKVDPSMPVPPGVLVDLVYRGLKDDASAKAEAVRSGIGPDAFDIMLKGAVHGPDVSALIAAYNRGVLPLGDGQSPDESLLGGLRQLGIDPMWQDIFVKLAVDWPSRQEVMNALLEGQITRDVAHDWYIKAGGNPDWFQIDFDSNGSAPTPVELGVMVNRRIIPVEGEGPEAVSFHQGFLEGPWRNKWEPSLLALAAYRLPPRSVTAMLRSGALTEAQATQKFEDYGVTPDDAAALIRDARPHTTTTIKQLTEGNIVQLYEDKLLTPAEATAALVGLKYSAADAAHILAMADFNNSVKSTNWAVGRIKTLYSNRKLSHTGAQDALVKLHVPAAQITQLFEIWDIEMAAAVKQLTEAQVAAALHYGVITEEHAMEYIQALGYTKFDAWVLLSSREHGPLPNKPDVGPNPVQIIP